MSMQEITLQKYLFTIVWVLILSLVFIARQSKDTPSDPLLKNSKDGSKFCTLNHCYLM